MTAYSQAQPGSTDLSMEIDSPAPDTIPADLLLESAIPAIIAGNQKALHTLEMLAPRAAAPENWERYFRLCAVYRGLLEGTARNLRLIRRATGRETMPVRHGVRSEGKSGDLEHGNPDHRV